LVDGSLESRCRILAKCNWTSFSLLLWLRHYKAKGVKTRCYQEGYRGRSVRAKISGGRGRPWGIFFGFYKTRHILLSNSAICTMLRAIVFTQYRRVTDGQTDGIAIASTALAKRYAVIIRHLRSVLTYE